MDWNQFSKLMVAVCYFLASLLICMAQHLLINVLWAWSLTINNMTQALGVVSAALAAVFTGLSYEEDDPDRYLPRAVLSVLIAGVSVYLWLCLESMPVVLP